MAGATSTSTLPEDGRRSADRGVFCQAGAPARVRVDTPRRQVQGRRQADQEQNVKVPLKQPIIRQEPDLPKPEARATEWADNNAWFGKDEPMTYTAFSLHKKLVEEEGYDPQSNDYYVELDRRIKLEFPHKFDKVTEQSTKPTQTVASATRGVNRAGRRTVTLTSSQVAIAKKLNVPLEEYAKQFEIDETEECGDDSDYEEEYDSEISLDN